MLGVIIAQLLRLSHSSNPNPILGFFVISVPLSSICHIMAILTTILGCYRFFHWQAEMARGYAISSGWELLTIFTLSFLVSLLHRGTGSITHFVQILISVFVLFISITIKDPDR